MGRLVRSTLPRAANASRVSLRDRPGLRYRFISAMGRHRVGLWLVGAFGGVGTTITLGLSAMARGLADRTGLVTELPLFRGLPLPEPGDFVVGGHDIRQTSFAESAEEFRRNSGVFPADWIAACRDDLRRGHRRGSGPGRASAPGRPSPSWDTGETPSRPGRREQAVDRIAADLAAFVESESIDHLIVLNVASTEPPFALGDVHRHWDTLNAALADGGPELLPASSLYAVAALRSRPHLHQLHAQPGRLAPGPRRAGRVHRVALRRQGRQDRRDADEDGARPDVRPCAT